MQIKSIVCKQLHVCCTHSVHILHTYWSSPICKHLHANCMHTYINMYTSETELHACLWANCIHAVCIHCVVKSFHIACMHMHALFYKGIELRTHMYVNQQDTIVANVQANLKNDNINIVIIHFVHIIII